MKITRESIQPFLPADLYKRYCDSEVGTYSKAEQALLDVAVRKAHVHELLYKEVSPQRINEMWDELCKYTNSVAKYNFFQRLRSRLAKFIDVA